jgi:hypothetical protein
VPSESPALFFNCLSATTGTAHTPDGLAINPSHFCAPAPDGHAAEPGNLVQ